MSCSLEICKGKVEEEMSHITVTMITPPDSRLVTNPVLVAVVSKFSEVQSTLTCSLYITPNSLLLLSLYNNNRPQAVQLSVIWFGALRNRQKAGEIRNKDGGYMDVDTAIYQRNNLLSTMRYEVKY